MEIYVRAFAVKEEGMEEWLGAWAPVPAQHVAENIFIIEENHFDEEDDYEFFIPGTKVLVEEITSQIDGEQFLGAVEEVKN
jgi:hypothetical protein